MTEWGIYLTLGFAAFFLGSIPFGLLIAHLYGVNDLRGQGSGNIGATNVSRIVGFWPAGVITFLLDAMKGILIIAPIKFHWIHEGFIPASDTLFWSLAFVSVLGHCYSPWLRFQGGKGVATIFGAIFLLAPWSGLLGGVAFGLTYIATRKGAAGSLMGLLTAISVHRIFYPYEPAFLIFGLMVLVAVYRHESNLDQLLAEEKSEVPNGTI